MNKSKNTRTTILLAILLALMIVGYRIMFVTPMDANSEESEIIGQRLQALLNDVDSINFDSTLTEDPVFQSLKSIDNPLISLPIGKDNPFGAGS